MSDEPSHGTDDANAAIVETERPASTATSFADFGDAPPRDVTPPLPGGRATSVRLVLAAAILGVAGDALTSLDVVPGAGLTLTLLLALAALGLLSRLTILAVESPWRWSIVVAMVALALSFTFRASDDLLAMNAFALFVAMILLSARVIGRRLPQIRLGEFLLGSVELPVVGIVRVFHAIAHLVAAEPTSKSRRHPLRGHGRDIAIGIGIAIPVLAVFAALLAAADAGFARLLGDLVDWDVRDALAHTVGIMLATFAFGAFLVAVLASVPLQYMAERRTSWAGPAVVWIVLGSTALLFATFAALQASYLFGGADFLDRTSGLSAAEYGRRGFFELSVVAALVVPLILAFRRWHAQSAGASHAFRVTAPALALLTILLQLSAFSRMWIYQSRFGLSEERVYATVILVWIAVGIAWIGIRIAVGRAPQLATFAVATGIALILVLDVANPAAIIARTNITRDSREPVDVEYLVDLGADAMPTILEHSKELSDLEREVLSDELEELETFADDDWRGANRARSVADERVAEHADR